MKAARWLALLVTLWAGPAHAGGRALVVESDDAGLGSHDGNPYWFATFKTLGMEFRFVPQRSLNTLELRNARYEELNGAVSQYDYLIVLAYRSGLGGCVGACANIDSLLTAAGWPSKPTLIISQSVRNSANMWTDGAFDSSGFGAANGPGEFLHREVVEYSAGNPLRAWHQAAGFAGFQAGPVPPGIFTILLKQHTNPYWNYRKIDLAVSDWDSIRGGADSLTLVKRSRADALGNPTGAPVFLCGAGFNLGAPEGSLRRVVCALAGLDSAGGNTLLFQTRPGPVRFTVQMQVLGGSGNYRHTPSDGIVGHAGIFTPAGVDSGDLAALGVTFDNFQSRGIKASVGVQTDPDSTGPGAPYRTQLERIRDRWPNAKVFPFDLGGLGDYIAGGAIESAGGNADATHNYDPFGAQRLRALVPAGCADPRLGCDCATDTTSVLCLLQRARASAVAFFGEGRIDAVWACPLEDFTPTYFGRSGGSLDSLLWVLHLCKIEGLRVGNMAVVNDAGSTGAGAPRGWMRNQAILPVRDPASGVSLGWFAFLPSRDSENSNESILYVGAAHDNQSEFLSGVFTGRWYYPSSSPVYSGGHDFFNRTMIYECMISWLGGSGDPLRRWKPGYWFVTDFQEWINTVNDLAGREVVEMSYGEDTAKWFIRSGLR